ncbi:hypothetical protein PTKIN_Ptkin05aG0081400 [Pterospermum kingtungense]
MGGVFPCFVIKTTNLNSLVLTLLFNLLTRFTFMLDEALFHLGLINLPVSDEAFLADHHQYPTNTSLPSTDSFRSRNNSSLVLDPAVQAETTRLIKNSLPVVEYGDFVRRFNVHEDEDAMSCVICLNYVMKSDEIRELSNCCHVFHRNCLDAWVDKDQLTCPLCRSSL